MSETEKPFDWSTVTEETHVRVYHEAGNASHVDYRAKGEPLDPIWDRVLEWKTPGTPGWHNAP